MAEAVEAVQVGQVAQVVKAVKVSPATLEDKVQTLDYFHS